MHVSRTTVARTVVALAFAASAAQASAQETPSNIRFGIWYPYVSQNGVPPQEAFAARGITATFNQGDLTPETLASYDVVFFGRSGMLGSSNYGTPGAITDIQAVVDPLLGP